MTTEAPFSNQEVIAVTGKLVVASRKELAGLIAQMGHKYVRPENSTLSRPNSTFSVLVVACDPSGAHIAKAKSIDATILTERQFLDQLPVPELIARAQAEASDPTTSKRRLTKLAAVVPEAVARNPLWTILYLESPDFLSNEDALLRLRLLRLAPQELIMPDDLHDDSLDACSSERIGLDVFASSGVTYEDSDDQCLSGSVSIGDYEITLYCLDCDAEMENVEADCEDRLSVRDAIRAYVAKPFDNLQEFASSCGLTCEESMSPCDGHPFRVGGIGITCKDDYIEYDLCSFPNDAGLIAKLTSAGDNAYQGVSLSEVGCRRPLFSSAPVADEDRAYEGAIDVRWACDCFVPIAKTSSDNTFWTKKLIAVEWNLHGTDLYAFAIDYDFGCPIEIERHLADEIDGGDDVSREINDRLIKVLGLARSDACEQL